MFPYGPTNASLTMPLTLVRFARQGSTSSWYHAVPVATILSDLESGSTLLSDVLAAHHKPTLIPAHARRSRWTVKTVAVRWRDVFKSEGAETSLLGLDPVGVERVFLLMDQRGWKDYVQIGYVVN